MLAGDGGAAGRRGAGEELRDVVVVEVDEDPAQREREEVRPQEAVGVHDGAPRRAETHRDAARPRGGRRRRMSASTSSGSTATVPAFSSVAVSPWSRRSIASLARGRTNSGGTEYAVTQHW